MRDAIEYRPKGGMCMTCVKSDSDCSALQFSTMPPIGEYKDRDKWLVVKIVRCTEFERAK